MGMLKDVKFGDKTFVGGSAVISCLLRQPPEIEKIYERCVVPFLQSGIDFAHLGNVLRHFTLQSSKNINFETIFFVPDLHSSEKLLIIY